MPSRAFHVWPTRVRPNCFGRAKAILPSSFELKARARGPTTGGETGGPGAPRRDSARVARCPPTLRYRLDVRWGRSTEKRSRTFVVDGTWSLGRKGLCCACTQSALEVSSAKLGLVAYHSKSAFPPLWWRSWYRACENARDSQPCLARGKYARFQARDMALHLWMTFF